MKSKKVARAYVMSAELSVEEAKKLAKAANKLAKELGIKKAKFDVATVCPCSS